jgi:hypothetical protein
MLEVLEFYLHKTSKSTSTAPAHILHVAVVRQQFKNFLEHYFESQQGQLKDLCPLLVTGDSIYGLVGYWLDANAHSWTI